MIANPELSALLHSLDPVINPGEYVFCTIQSAILPAGVHALMTFQEHEGLTFILDLLQAESLGISHSDPFAWITLKVYSSLTAVGLTAAVSAALAQAGIACNMAAGFHHDHCFVPIQQADRAMAVLRGLQR